MTGYLVRIGADQAFGGWNAPVDPITGEFVYVPIPENAVHFHPGCRRMFDELVPALQTFCDCRRLNVNRDLRIGQHSIDQPMHLDPDFVHLSYGDNGAKRGAGIAGLADGDLIVFYAGLRPVSECNQRLLYSLVGLYVVEEVVRVSNILPNRWHENAHTRKLRHCPTDIVVRAKRGISGRLERSISVGEWRDGAYRVRNDVLRAWGGLSVKNGFIQRSAVPPRFQAAEQFYEWFRKQRIPLVERNN